MKFFETGSKLNFVDDKNCFVGFDNESDCCESWGWLIAESIPLSGFKIQDLNTNHNYDFEGFNFDKTFFEERSEEDLDAGSIAIFKLKRDRKVIYLILWNSHNGYYSHGFEFKNKEQLIKGGSL